MYDSSPARLVLQHCDGGTLADLWRAHVAAGATVVECEVAFVLRQLVFGLRAIKSAGLVHHDVKPTNVLACLGANAAVQLKLSDVDGAFIVDGGSGNEPVAAHKSEGTPLFSAPECFEEAHRCGYESDVWSLGIVALHLAEQGVTPRANENPYRVASLVCNGEPPTLSDATKWSAPMVAFISGCLQKVHILSLSVSLSHSLCLMCAFDRRRPVRAPQWKPWHAPTG